MGKSCHSRFSVLKKKNRIWRKQQRLSRRDALTVGKSSTTLDKSNAIVVTEVVTYSYVINPSYMQVADPPESVSTRFKPSPSIPL